MRLALRYPPLFTLSILLHWPLTLFHLLTSLAIDPRFFRISFPHPISHSYSPFSTLPPSPPFPPLTSTLSALDTHKRSTQQPVWHEGLLPGPYNVIKPQCVALQVGERLEPLFTCLAHITRTYLAFNVVGEHWHKLDHERTFFYSSSVLLKFLLFTLYCVTLFLNHIF